MIDLKELCELLSDYFDEELDSDICDEVEKLMDRDFRCESLCNTFSKTIELCRELEEEEEMDVPEEIHIQLHEFLRVEIIRITKRRT